VSSEAQTTNYPPDQVQFLRIDGRDFILVGTAHVSKGSTDLVREVIEREKPDHVAVELDTQRHQALTEQQRWESLDIKEIIR
jgi:pheromone shutdown protein TraB